MKTRGEPLNHACHVIKASAELSMRNLATVLRFLKRELQWDRTSYRVVKFHEIFSEENGNLKC